MTREPVKDRLRGHRALWQLGKVATLEMLGHAVVERPERAAFEFLMARVAELLNRLVDGTRRKRARHFAGRIRHFLPGASGNLRGKLPNAARKMLRGMAPQTLNPKP